MPSCPGRAVPELEGYGFKRLIHQNFRIVYRTAKNSDDIEILAVVHSARENWESLKRRIRMIRKNLHEKNGAEIFIESLIKEGVDTIFGFPGARCCPYTTRSLKAPLSHILVRHEQGAVHMADGYARGQRTPGVVVLSRQAPEATNTVTGIATAYMDSIPVVVFTGQVPTAPIGNDAFQEADIVGITRPCTKHNYLW